MTYCHFKGHLERPARSARIVCILFIVIIVLFKTAFAGEVQGPTVKELDGIIIRSERFPSGPVKLNNGEYRVPATPGSAVELVVKMTDKRVSGTINNKDTAAIVLVTETGGSGAFFDLALLLKEKDRWVNSDTALLGDRVKVKSITIGYNEIIVSMTVHGPNDAMCCPTREMTRRFMVQENRLVAVQDARTETQDAGIIGPVWQWVRTRYNDDTARHRPVDSPGYTLQLNEDGTVKIRGDCNAGGGSYTIEGRKLSIAISHTTRAACPEGSLEDPYIIDLNRTAGFLLKNKTLFLDLKLDTGTMEFQKK